MPTFRSHLDPCRSLRQQYKPIENGPNEIKNPGEVNDAHHLENPGDAAENQPSLKSSKSMLKSPAEAKID